MSSGIIIVIIHHGEFFPSIVDDQFNDFLQQKFFCRDYEKEQLPQNELQIHTWMDATLGELTQLIKDVIPDVRTRGIQFAFAIVSPDGSYNRYHISEIGKTENGQQRPDNQIQLGSKRFHVGDYIDVAIIRRRPDAPHSSSLANNRRDRGGPGHSSEDSNRRRHGGGGGGGANDRNERNDRNGSGNGPTRSGPSGW